MRADRKSSGSSKKTKMEYVALNLYYMTKAMIICTPMWQQISLSFAS